MILSFNARQLEFVVKYIKVLRKHQESIENERILKEQEMTSEKISGNNISHENQKKIRKSERDLIMRM